MAQTTRIPIAAGRQPPLLRLDRAVAVPASALRVAVYALFAVQVYRGVRLPLDAFTQSYWLVNYSHGFIRRGLTGSGLDLVVGRPTPLAVRIAAFVVVAPAIAGVAWLLRSLLRKGTDGAAATALLLATSPLLVGYLAFQRRPDQLGLALLLGLAFSLHRSDSGRLRWVALVGIGLGLGAMVLVHEGVILEDVPFAAVLVAMLRPAPRRTDAERTRRTGGLAAELSAVVLPGLVALAAVATFGSVDAATAAQLRAHAAFAPSGTTEGLTMFDFLPQSLHSAVALVRHGSKRDHAMMIGLGAVLLGLQWLWLRTWAGWRLTRVLRERVGRPWALALVVAVLVAALGLFVTGVDWIRWFGALGAGWLVVAGFGQLHGVPVEPPAPRVRLPLLLPVVAAYLLTFAPLPTAAPAHAVLHLLTR